MDVDGERGCVWEGEEVKTVVETANLATTVDAATGVVVNPISTYIEPLKRQSRRHYAHAFFTKRAYNVVQHYIAHFSGPYETVLDPFCGSGVVPTEALVLRRRTIALDVSQFACFLTKAVATSPVDLDEFEAAFRRVEALARDRILATEELESATLQRMLSEHEYPSDPIPAYVDQHHVGTVDRLFSPAQLISYSILRDAIRDVDSPAMRELLFFAFSSTLGTVNLMYSSPQGRLPSRGQAGLWLHKKYWLPAVPTHQNVWDVFRRRVQRVKLAKEETNTLIGVFFEEGNTFSLYHHSATRLDELLPECSVDYVFTDPPYGGNIAYLDLSAMWNAWLGLEVGKRDREDEVIEGGSLQKTKEQYLEQLTLALKGIARVLKPDRWLSLVFAHKDLEFWSAIISSCDEAGLRYVNAVPQPTRLPSFTKVANPLTTLSGEMIVNFRKMALRSYSLTYRKQDLAEGLARVPSLHTFLRNEAERVIAAYLGATTEEIYFQLSSKLLDFFTQHRAVDQLETAIAEIGDLSSFLAKHFRKTDGSWLLGKGYKLGLHVPLNDRVRYYVYELLLSCAERGASLDEVYERLLPAIPDWGASAPADALSVLRTMAVQRGTRWVLDDARVTQLRLPLEPVSPLELEPPYRRSWPVDALKARLRGRGMLRGVHGAPAEAYEEVNQLSRGEIRGLLAGIPSSAIGKAFDAERLR
jgi:16S rRNA G966 N2-methylase RsmD